MLSKALKIARKYNNFTKAQLSFKLGIPQTRIIDIESGEEQPSLDVLKAYSRALNIRLSSLLFFAERLEKEPECRVFLKNTVFIICLIIQLGLVLFLLNYPKIG